MAYKLAREEELGEFNDPTMDIAMDTIKKKKQAIVFCSTKRGAEKTAEDFSKKIKSSLPAYKVLSQDILKAVSPPTKQCNRLAGCVSKGVAFHHSGLHAKQREIIEDNFRKGLIKVICSTPTLCLSTDTKIWHSMHETEVTKFPKNKSLFVLSSSKLINMRVQKIEQRINQKKLIKITSISGYTIKVTPNHRMFIKRAGKKQVINAKDITKRDKIATVGNLLISKCSNPKISSFILNNQMNCLDMRFNEDLSYVIGAMLGDGYSGAETLNNKIIYNGSPCIVGIDEEVFSSIKAVCKILNISCRKSKTYHNTPQLVLGKNKWFREFLVRSGVEKRNKKHIADKLMTMPKINTIALLQGLFDTDGYVNSRGSVGFSNISRQLIDQIQKLLLRFGIVSSIKTRKPGKMKIYNKIKIYDKKYDTVTSYELLIKQKRSIIDFHRDIGFKVEKKNKMLNQLVDKMQSNILYCMCNKCDYKIYKDLFSGRSMQQKEWGKTKLKIIKILGTKNELKSKDLNTKLKQLPRKKDLRLNHHYELIKKRKDGNKEWLWSLNEIGLWIYKNIINKNKNFAGFFNLKKCPICKNELSIKIKKGWRDADFEGDIFWDIIREIKEVRTEKKVYDVVLGNKPKNDHLFVANGFIVHNSAGLDMPAFRTVIKDLRRYSGGYYDYIPVLEYHQMAGRAGRPGKENKGEAICISKDEFDKEEIIEKFLFGDPEVIYSKLAVEPVLRMYVLSLISSGFLRSYEEIIDFFKDTFWAKQFQDLPKLTFIIKKVLKMLSDWEFILATGDKVRATRLGTRVSQLYLDPLTANDIISALNRSQQKVTTDVSFIQLVSSTIEMRPLLTVRVKEYQKVEQFLIEHEDEFIAFLPSQFDYEYEDFLRSLKITMFLLDWINEIYEKDIMEKYNIRPGEIHVKLDNADWLLYATQEIAKLLGYNKLLTPINKVRVRLKYGIKEELLALVKFKNVGRVRARKLYKNGIKNVGDVKHVAVQRLAMLIGQKNAANLKEQVGQKPEKDNKIGDFNV